MKILRVVNGQWRAYIIGECGSISPCYIECTPDHIPENTMRDEITEQQERAEEEKTF